MNFPDKRLQQEGVLNRFGAHTLRVSCNTFASCSRCLAEELPLTCRGFFFGAFFLPSLLPHVKTQTVSRLEANEGEGSGANFEGKAHRRWCQVQGLISVCTRGTAILYVVRFDNTIVVDLKTSVRWLACFGTLHFRKV